MNSLLQSLRHRVKEFVLEADGTLVRGGIDRILRTRVAGEIGLADYRRRHEAIRGQLEVELGRILAFDTDFEAELYVRRFEADFAKRCGRRYAVGTQSGTSALQLSLVALDIGPGDEVVTVPNTYVATALAISNAGARPVFVDVDERTFNLDAARIEAAITPRTRAIMPVHLFGQVADMPEINRIAARHGLKVIEDACQAFGAELQGRKAGSFGDVACFSFSTPKILSGFGNGGIMVTDDRAVMERLRTLRNPESDGECLRSSRRTPCYLDAVQIAFLRAKLPFVEDWIERRRSIAKTYGTLPDGLRLPEEVPGGRHTYYQFAARTRHRDELQRWLRRHGVRAGTAYPCLHLTRLYSDPGRPRGTFPTAEAIERESLLLPISSFLEQDEVHRVADEIGRFFTSSRRHDGAPD